MHVSDCSNPNRQNTSRCRSERLSASCTQPLYRASTLRIWARLKEWRAIATRYEKTARSFLGILCLAAAADWIKL